MILYDNEANGLEVSDGPSASHPGFVRVNVHDEEHFKASTLLSPREAFEVADALTHGKLQALLDALDEARDVLDINHPKLIAAREALR